MDLLDSIRQDVLRQKEEEIVNHFCMVVCFREFAETKPAVDVGVSGKCCCLFAERLKTDNGTRVTASDSSQHGLFEQTAEVLNNLTPGKRKPYIFQITVWGGKKKKGDMRSPRMAFRPGALYEFRQIDGVSFYADVPTGRAQFDSEGGKINEVLPPMIKRKAGRDAGKKRAKAKTQEATSRQSTTKDDDEEDVIMAAEGKSENPVVAVRTRSNGAVGPNCCGAERQRACMCT
ncbi:hypothetical protein PF005_g14332 [Phytophthora fragariae]|uniref:Uncharacterized protein n=1 Tax=Phytophthora fragariae TaxID=53985 RepID=A0A6A3EDL0_9STRA|nr:hypothetical protein PF003_g14948 [Phytophthora fragariae]KAE8931854.1 hypothetical protein PF009_g18099 [Phytophthora fragariae]KAE9001676.1 hypothetical protein PF011_g13642 [Phytophthora fragariae]KAE9101970.1 hypothetical protein PF007_g14924 [Phytophthora fragariae]KAE9133733.1 hypothetical protein PF006_g14977 [Phytophthora fragariae]